MLFQYCVLIDPRSKPRINPLFDPYSLTCPIRHQVLEMKNPSHPFHPRKYLEMAVNFAHATPPNPSIIVLPLQELHTRA